MTAPLPLVGSMLPLPTEWSFLPAGTTEALPIGLAPRRGSLVCADDPEDADDELGDEEDLTVPPSVDEESSFDDFDDDFDDDFEEEDNDPDWDHPEENEPPPPPAKGPSKRK